MGELSQGFKSSYSERELDLDFSLTVQELQFIGRFNGESNRQASAILLKTLPYLGRFPESLLEVPEVIRRYIAAQLGSLFDFTDTYVWDGRSRERHQAEIRAFTGWQVARTEHKKDLFEWLRVEGAISAFTTEKLQDMSVSHLRTRRIERPASSELERIANSALAAFFDDSYRGITDSLSPEVQSQLDQLLEIEEGESLSPLEQMKRDAGEASNKNLQTKAAKLKRLRAVAVPFDAFRLYPWKLLSGLARRAANDNVWDMRGTPTWSVARSWRSSSTCEVPN